MTEGLAVRSKTEEAWSSQRVLTRETSPPTRFPRSNPLLTLTRREREILGLLSRGSTNDEIADILTLRPSTVRSHVQSVLTKLGVHSRLKAAAVADSYGFGQLPLAWENPFRSKPNGHFDSIEAPLPIVIFGPQHARELLARRFRHEYAFRIVADIDDPASFGSAIALGADIAVVCGLPWVEAMPLVEVARRCRPTCRILIVANYEPLVVLRALDAGVLGLVSTSHSADEVVDAASVVARGDYSLPMETRAPLLQLLLKRRLAQRTRSELMDCLTRREREVLALLAEGSSNEAIARRLTISRATARTHVRNILHKLGVHSRVAAASIALSSTTSEDDP